MTDPDIPPEPDPVEPEPADEYPAVLPQAAIDNVLDATWYANWLAGAVTETTQVPPLTFEVALCRFRGVDEIWGGVAKAVNEWAGITDPDLYQPINICLNMIVGQLGDPGAGTYDNGRALQAIAISNSP